MASKYNAINFLLLCGLFLCIAISTGMGYIKIPVPDVLKIIAYRITGDESLISNLNHVYPYVIWDVRLPRILASAIVGAGLSICGAVFQAILLNPLADPYTLGISAGAAFGGSISLFLDIRWFGIYSTSIFAFTGAIGTLIAVISISRASGSISSHTLILSGIIVSAILSAFISFIKYIADEHVAVLIFWLMGSFVSKSWEEVITTFSLVGFGFVIFMLLARDLDIISLGDRTASSLGINPEAVRLLLLVSASVVTAGCVAISGIIGFVGLVVPHLMRSFVGSNAERLIPASAIAGALLLMVADTITRAVLPKEVPIGVITAIIGGPFFCYIFVKRSSMSVHER
ncbi:iron ABC transporter permease [Candidatus Woesearchaeota archaeon]|nr:MAG: iron ABC transporter permease [Candidatus Woesearchaeota archaeon]